MVSEVQTNGSLIQIPYLLTQPTLSSFCLPPPFSSMQKPGSNAIIPEVKQCQGREQGKIIFSRFPQDIISQPWIRDLINKTVLAGTATTIQGDLLSLPFEKHHDQQRLYILDRCIVHSTFILLFSDAGTPADCS